MITKAKKPLKTKITGGDNFSVTSTDHRAKKTSSETTLEANLDSASTFAKSNDAWRYSVDFMQRSLLFLDVLRERGDNMLAHERAGQPPLLDFDH